MAGRTSYKQLCGEKDTLIKELEKKLTEQASAIYPTVPVPAQSAKTGKAFVTIQKTGSEDVTEESVVEVETFVTQPAVITLKYGVTKNLGQFESARVDVGISIPCYKERVDDAFADADAWVTEKLKVCLDGIEK